MKKLLLVGLMAAAGAAQAQTAADVGDLDSFGRNVVYLGLGGTGTTYVTFDCTDTPSTGSDHCIVAKPQPQTTTFEYRDGDTIKLPARVTNSLLCFTMTPLIYRRFANNTNAPANAALTLRALLTLKSPVLNNLVNADTGQPFNGKIEIVLGARNEGERMQPGDMNYGQTQISRSCQGALISKRSLVEGYGLTAAQAASVFNNPISLSLGMSGSATLVEDSFFSYSIRLYGDKR